ncbi:transposase [Romboutsia sp.]|uniref:transposase n=1 Tax=Romboutsia sp. TaxID=1965302 RepID=UPI003F30EA7A
MTRKKIEWNEGAIYHITARGNRRNDIYKDEEDFQVYLTMLEEALDYYEFYNYKIISYCLMDNHVHIILKTDTKPPGELISRVHSIYTKYFNKKYNYIGHLFQDRYYFELIENDSQLLETSRYVHLNPVKARMVEMPGDYKWSSYQMLIGEKDVKLIDDEILLKYFKHENRFRLYKEFIEMKLKSTREQLELSES